MVETMREVLRSASVEFISTCLFVWVGTGTAVSVLAYTTVPDDPANIQLVGTGMSAWSSSVVNNRLTATVMPISFAFGFCIALLVYATAHLSGGHINPAVTFGLLLAKQISALKAVAYVVAQLSGAVLGSAILLGCIGNTKGVARWDLGANNVNTNIINSGNAFLLEMMGTFLLVFVVFCTAVDKNGSAKNMAPFAIGCAVAMAHLVLIHFTGCGINPARSFGPHVVNSFNGVNSWGEGSWVYYTAPFVGSALAVGVAKIYIDTDSDKNKKDLDVVETAEQEPVVNPAASV